MCLFQLSYTHGKDKRLQGTEQTERQHAQKHSTDTIWVWNVKSENLIIFLQLDHDYACLFSRGPSKMFSNCRLSDHCILGQPCWHKTEYKVGENEKSTSDSRYQKFSDRMYESHSCYPRRRSMNLIWSHSTMPPGKKWVVPYPISWMQIRERRGTQSIEVTSNVIIFNNGSILKSPSHVESTIYTLVSLNILFKSCTPTHWWLYLWSYVTSLL